jgi:hypothetical protein
MNNTKALLSARASALMIAAAVIMGSSMIAHGKERVKSTSARVLPKPVVRGAGGTGLYAGWQACIECHQSTYNTVIHTEHAKAFSERAFLVQGGQGNATCWSCHTTGYGAAGGFVSPGATPQLAGVQCESCHGPAARHAANPGDPTVTPPVNVAASVCGSCHTGTQQPTYEQWQTSGHAVPPTPSMDPSACGRCHIGSARLAMLNGKSASQADGTFPVVCATCHDAHATHSFKNPLNGIINFTNSLTSGSVEITNNELGAVYVAQLFNPLASTNDYSLSTTDPFPAKYNANVNICAQCHNRRGATWTDSSRPPHRSPQYNFLIGTVGELPGGTKPNFPATHSRIETQCVGCHMPDEAHPGPPEVPPIASHTFKVSSYENCAQCHGSASNAADLVTVVQQVVTEEIAILKAALDEWANTKAPPVLRAKYGSLAWEYTNPGELSPGGSGPTKAEQTLIPDAIKKARFNAYILLNDGSYGVHNGPFASTLYNAAYEWIQDELSR